MFRQCQSDKKCLDMPTCRQVDTELHEDENANVGERDARLQGAVGLPFRRERRRSFGP